MLVSTISTGTGIGVMNYTVSAASEWSSTAVYVGGDEVTYNGNTYRAQWWTQGDEPGTN